MQRTAADMKQLGSSLSRSLTAPLLGIAAISVKTAADFEFAMAKVQAVSGFTAGEMAKLTAQAQALGASTSKTQDEVAALQLELAKLGKSSSEIEAMTEDVLNLSIAFDQDLGETARVIGATLNQFGLDASEAGRVADNMAILFGNSALDLEKFDAAMRTVGPTANALGLSLEETGAAMGILVNAGIDASTVGTALTKALTTMAKEGYNGKDALEAITSGSLSVAEAFDFFGDRAGKIIPVLQGTNDELQNYVEKQELGIGAAAAARKTLEETTKGGFDKLASAVSAAATTIGQKLLPRVNKFLGFITDLVSKFASLDGGIITAILSIGTLVAAIGPAIFIAGQMIFAYSQLAIATEGFALAQIKARAAMLLNPYVLLAGAVAYLGYQFYKTATATTAFEDEQKALADARERGMQQYAEEGAKVKALAHEYKLFEGNLERRKTIIEDLKKIAPKHFEDLDAEKTSYEDLAGAVADYNLELRAAAIQAAFGDELQRVFKDQLLVAAELRKATIKQAELEQKKANGAKTHYNTIKDAASVTTEFGKEYARANGEVSRLEAKQQALNASAKELEGLIKDANAELAKFTAGLDLGGGDDDGGGGGGGNNSNDERKKDLELLEATSGILDDYLLQQLQEVKRNKDLERAIRLVKYARSGERQEIQKTTNAVQGLLRQDFDLTVGQQLSRVFNSLPEIVSDTFDDIRDQANALGQTIGDALGGAFIIAKQENQSFNEALKSTGREALGVILAEVVGMAIRNAFEAAGATGPLALVLAPALAGAAAGAAKSLFASTVPAFAQGGMVTGPMLSLLGDNPSGKEMVIPFERMGEFASRLLPNLGGSNDVNVHGVIQGRNLLLVHERGVRNQSRYR